MSLQAIPQSASLSSPLDTSISRLQFLFSQLEAWQIEGIINQVHRSLPVPVVSVEKGFAGDAPASRKEAAQRAIVQLLYMIAAQSYADILFALTYAETLALMKGADDEHVGIAH